MKMRGLCRLAGDTVLVWFIAGRARCVPHICSWRRRAVRACHFACATWSEQFADCVKREVSAGARHSQFHSRHRLAGGRDTGLLLVTGPGSISRSRFAFGLRFRVIDAPIDHKPCPARST